MKIKGVIGIHAGFLYYPIEYMHQWDETNLENGGIGGSEIWAIELSNKLQERGYQVIVFADCKEMHFAKTGVMYVPCDYLYEGNFKNMHFDYFITSRDVYFLENDINCDHLYIMFHDTKVPVRLVFYENDWLQYDENYNKIIRNKIEKVFYQSDFQKKELIKNYGFSEDVFVRTSQALDTKLYENVDVEKKQNRMVWSTHKKRGAKLLIEKILPLIRKEVPDFEIDVCGYVNDMVDDYFKAEGVVVHGNVPKEKLIELQKNAKIWIYPNTGLLEDGSLNDETFCITAIENGLAENVLILAEKTCFKTTLEGYTNFVGTELFDENKNVLNEDLIDEFCKKLAENAIKMLKNEEYLRRNYICHLAKNICRMYTWDNVADGFINEFEKQKTNG